MYVKYQHATLKCNTRAKQCYKFHANTPKNNEDII